jgi:hypothetical protein
MLHLRGSIRCALFLLPFAALACGASGDTTTPGTGGHGGHASGSGGAGSVGGGGDLGLGGSLDHGPVVSLSIDPPQAGVESLNGAPVTQDFKAIASYQDGTTGEIAASWSATSPAVGAIDGSGTFTANGQLGGIVKVTAKADGKQAEATLTVKLHVQENPASADAPTQAGLKQASAPDGAVTWAYPYDGTVLPRGIGAMPLMWFGGAADDVYYVHLTSSTFELESFVTAPGQRFDFDPALWEQLLESTSGALELKVARASGGATTVIVDHHDTVASASMRGTIYYWAINTGRVMRIKPGAAQAENFIPGVACPSCHTVSANGSKLVMNTGTWPDETSVAYDLGANQNSFSGYFSAGGGASEWALAGVSANGQVVVENFAPLRGNIGKQVGAFDSTSAALIPSSGLDKALWMPAFSPDDQLLAYVDANTHDLRAYDWDAVAQKASNDRLIVTAGGDAATKMIQFPTASPDHQWLIYQRSSALGSMGVAGDLYMASVASPGTEVALDALNGTNYPFAAGDRDRHYDYEPTFAPVAAGGYFWVVFHSRRTFGNALTGPAYVGDGQGTKQLWVAAIDQNPQPGKDPSHPAFLLPGQDLTTLNMRGYWALDPCKGDGEGCQTGTDCCGGYCDDGGDAGAPVCKSQSSGCSNAGDHCDASADCCDKSATCINHVCSEAPPQ